MSVPLPSGLTFGFVVGRFVLIVGDSPGDPDALPDERPASALKIKFTPSRTVQRVGEVPTTVLRAPLDCEVGPDGQLREVGSPDPGVWLVTGGYSVSFSGLSSHAVPRSFSIVVSPEHTEENPLDLTLWSASQEVT